MRIGRYIQICAVIVLAAGFGIRANAQSSAPSSTPTTEVGIYVFMTAINGTGQLGPVTSDIDVSFSDLLKTLDIGFMGYVEHQRGKWSFIGDLFYADLSTSGNLASGPVLTLAVDAKIKQTLAEAFVGYQVYEKTQGDRMLSVDALGGLRYNKLDISLDTRATVLGLPTAASRSRDEDWIDAVVGLRAKYDFGNGWNLGGWADIGKGADSSSYQLFANASYTFANNVKVFGGYRLYHFEYDSDPGPRFFSIDVDFSGPMAGVAYRF